VAYLAKQPDMMTAGEIAAGLGKAEETEAIFTILRHLAANPERSVKVTKGGNVAGWKFSMRA